jgi:hypothetical protein
MLTLFGNGDYVVDTAAIRTKETPSASATHPNFDILLISEGFRKFQTGKQYPVEVGNPALGVPNMNQSWDDGSGLFKNSLIPSYLQLSDYAPSTALVWRSIQRRSRLHIPCILIAMTSPGFWALLRCRIITCTISYRSPRHFE